MQNTIKTIIGSITVFALIGCASVRHQSVVESSSKKTKTAFKGQKLVRIKKVEDLKNAFGKRDIWGGKVDKGYTEIYFAGQEGAKLKFVVVEVDVDTNASVYTRYMNRGPTFTATSKKNFDGTVTTTGEVNPGLGQEEWRQQLPPNSYEIVLDYPNEKEIDLDNINVEVLSVAEGKITFDLFQPN